jgi:hypothetical protein
LTLRLVFWRSDKPRERILADAFCHGVRAHGDEAEELPLAWDIPDPLPQCDIACMVGVKSRRRFEAHSAAGIHTLYLDKGYIRSEADGHTKAWKYWRVALGSHHPTRYLDKMHFKPDRWAKLGLKFKPWVTRGDQILLAGSSEKYHEFYGLKPPDDYYKQICKRIDGLTEKTTVVYRPKPSYHEAQPIEGAMFSRGGTIEEALSGCRLMVTHGSNAVFESVLRGVPTLVLGDAVTRPISSTQIEDINSPRKASDEERLRLLQALAYCQWTCDEMRSGEAWAHIKGEFYRTCV